MPPRATCWWLLFTVMPLILAQAMCSANAKGNDVSLLGCAQGALERMGLDASAAVARARSRSQSRVGRKRARSVAASAGASAAMDVDGEPAKKRVHSSKSRCATSPVLVLCARPAKEPCALLRLSCRPVCCACMFAPYLRAHPGFKAQI